MSSSRVLAGVLGAVLACPLVAGCGQSEPAGQRPAPPSAPEQPSAPKQAGPSGSEGRIGEDQAGKIATDEYGGEVIDIEPDTAKGSPSWEVEIRNSSEGRIEVDVSQSTGKILEKEVD